MKIVQIVKKNDKKVFVHFDNDEKIVLSKDLVYQNGLRKSDEISEEQLKNLLEQEKKINIKQKALALLGRRAHSKRELFNKLRRHSSDTKLIEECLSDLEQKGLIDDKIFATLYTQDKIRWKKWGRPKIKIELFKRGVTKEIINEVIENFFDSNLEKEKILELVRKKLNQFKGKITDKKIIYQKLMYYLLSKGYDIELVIDILKKELNFDEEESI